MSDSEILQDIKDILSAISTEVEHRLPTDLLVTIDDAHPYVMDYRGYRHVFLWTPTSLTLSAEEYGSGPTPAQQWHNLALRPGTQLVTVGQSALTPIILRHTDEVVP